MRTLSEITTTLFLALAARYANRKPELADAAALIAGRTQKWTVWPSLSLEEQTQIAVGLRLRPMPLAQPSYFLKEAYSVFADEFSLFQLCDPDRQGHPLSESDTYCVKADLNLDVIITEHYEALRNWRQPGRTVALPEGGDILLKSVSASRTKLYNIKESERPFLPSQSQVISVANSPATPQITWHHRDLHDLALQLDSKSGLHNSHVSSLKNLWGKESEKTVNAGNFYRINAATGTGKSVVMLLMAINAAARGHKTVVAVPSLVDVANTVQSLSRSAQATSPMLKVAPLHSFKRIPEQASLQFVQEKRDHPYDYSCLLNTFGTELEDMPVGQEPCFRLQLTDKNAQGEESSKKLRHCPFLFTCGMTSMLEEALEADIIVVNHHAVLSGSTQIPFDDSDKYPGPRSFIELLLRHASVFLVDEIDGLLKSAIDGSAFDLELGNANDSSPLKKLNSTLVGASRIPGIDRSSLLRIKWPLNYCANGVDQLMYLQQRRYFEWPKKETTWASAEDGLIMRSLGISFDTLQNLCSPEEADVPDHLKDLRRNLILVSGQNAPHPEHHAMEIGRITASLSAQDLLPSRLGQERLKRLKAALILRRLLDLTEASLRDLQSELPSFVGAEVPFAYDLQRDLKGREPLSLSPFGPLHRTVYGFKRRQVALNESVLNVVAMRGDPHSMLLALPDISALGYAGVKRAFLGFSATAYFPGASAYDLKARDFIDVPDAEGQVTFEDIPLQTVVSGAPFHERPQRIKDLAQEIWPRLQQLLTQLSSATETKDRARLLLVANSDADAELLAITLSRLAPTPIVGWVRGRASEARATALHSTDTLIYDDLTEFTSGKHKDKTILVSALQPMARGHNIVNDDGLSAIGAVVVCVRPLPSSDDPKNNLAHLCYETWNTIAPSSSLSGIFRKERALANMILHSIRSSPPAFNQQPANVRHYTVMNILVSLTQLIGRGRRGGTPVTCYFADGAFRHGRVKWYSLLDTSVKRLKDEGVWPQFANHHNGIATAVEQYIRRSVQEAS